MLHGPTPPQYRCCLVAEILCDAGDATLTSILLSQIFYSGTLSAAEVTKLSGISDIFPEASVHECDPFACLPCVAAFREQCIAVSWCKSGSVLSSPMAQVPV